MQNRKWWQDEFGDIQPGLLILAMTLGLFLTVVLIVAMLLGYHAYASVPLDK